MTKLVCLFVGVLNLQQLYTCALIEKVSGANRIIASNDDFKEHEHQTNRTRSEQGSYIVVSAKSRFRTPADRRDFKSALGISFGL